MKRLTTILLVILSSCSISYKFNGASINYETTKTISVANFPIKAALVYPPLEELFTNSLKTLIPGKRDYKWLAAEETCNWKEKSRIMTSPRKP